ncbi:MAG TPA: phasin family protein [Allosphingosinicella sp.]
MADTKTDTASTDVKKADAPAAAAPKAEAAQAAKADAAPAPKGEAAKADAPKAEAAKAAAPAKATAAKAKPAARAVRAKAAARKTAATKAPARKAAAAKAAKAPARTAAPARKAVAAQAAAAKTIVSKTSKIQIEGTRTMKNEANQIADRVQAVFGDANERAKTLVERNSRLAEELTELTKGNVEAIVASTKLAAKGLETVGQDVAEFSRKSFEDASAALKGFAEVKSPTDFFRLQSDFARSQFDAFVSESSKLSETVIKLAGDVAEPLTSRYSVAAERVKAAVAA